MHARLSRLLVAAVAALASGAARAEQAPTTESATPISALPYSPSLDLTSMDRSVDPCVDFYRYSCGGWLKKNPIPSDQPGWSVYAKLAYDNERLLWGILEDAAKPDAKRTPAQQKIGDYFATCMDEAATEKAGAKPIASELASVSALKRTDDLPKLLAQLHSRLDTDHTLFGVGSEQDFQDANQIMAVVAAGGLGLPDRDYYVKDDARSQQLRADYVKHVGKVFELLGQAPESAAASAKRVLEIETALAKASLTRTEKRDPHNVYHLLTVEQLQKETPHFAWKPYLASLGLGQIKSLIVTEPAFFKAMDGLLTQISLDDLKTYLRWHVAYARESALSPAFVQANFDFYQRELRGVKVLPPRWKRCVRNVERDLGEALGQVYVERTFSAEQKRAAAEMVQQIQQAMDRRIHGLPWMSEPTKAKALEKLRAMRNKVGYPEKWRDYSSLEIRRGDLVGNVGRANAFELRRQLNKIGKPVDRGEWQMIPPEVNAYYDPSMNDMNFPAGVLQPPLFDLKMDAAPNFGNTGGTIGHELTHGFDDEGRQFDAQGNLKDWWTAADAKAFNERAQCIVDQYGSYTVVDDIKLNSKLTLGEDVADLGGLIIAYEAWKQSTEKQKLAPVDNLTPDQRFFVGFAQWDCAEQTPETKRLSAITNPHSPGWARINGVVVNMPEFARAFSCKAGSPMVKAKPCQVW